MITEEPGVCADEVDESSSAASRREVRAISVPKSVMQKAQSVARKVTSLIWKSESPASKLTFHIYALRQSTVASVKESLQSKLEGLVNTSVIRNDAIASLTSQDVTDIYALKSPDVGIEIGKLSLLPSCASFALNIIYTVSGKKLTP